MVFDDQPLLETRVGRLYLLYSPRGDMLTLWDGTRARCEGVLKVRDVAGVSAARGGFYATSGSGLWLRLNHKLRVLGRRTHPGLSWDNHLATASRGLGWVRGTG